MLIVPSAEIVKPVLVLSPVLTMPTVSAVAIGTSAPPVAFSVPSSEKLRFCPILTATRFTPFSSVIAMPFPALTVSPPVAFSVPSSEKLRFYPILTATRFVPSASVISMPFPALMVSPPAPPPPVAISLLSPLRASPSA